MNKKAIAQDKQTSSLKRDIAELVNGGKLLGGDAAKRGNRDHASGGLKQTGQRSTANATENSSASPKVPKPVKKPSVKKPVQASKIDAILEHPSLKKMLLKSTIQKTLRFSPVLIAEYEQMCESREMEVAFNKHMNEALELLLDKYRC